MIESTNRQSFIDFGYFNQSNFHGGSAEAAGLVWFPMPTYKQILFWLVETSAIRFGETDENIGGMEQAYKFTKNIPAVVDTGTSMIIIPKQISTDFFGRILKGHKYVMMGGMYSISCNNQD